MIYTDGQNASKVKGRTLPFYSMLFVRTSKLLALQPDCYQNLATCPLEWMVPSIFVLLVLEYVTSDLNRLGARFFRGWEILVIVTTITLSFFFFFLLPQCRLGSKKHKSADRQPSANACSIKMINKDLEALLSCLCIYCLRVMGIAQ